MVDFKYFQREIRKDQNVGGLHKLGPGLTGANTISGITKSGITSPNSRASRNLLNSINNLAPIFSQSPRTPMRP
jgi:hypothetical protein